MKHGVYVLCLIAIALTAIAQVDDAPAPSPVAFTSEPRQLQWRIGFDLGNATVLETPELNPDGDFRAAVTEAQRILPRPHLAYGLALLPYDKLSARSAQLVNPRQWTIVDLQGKATRRTFQGIGVFMGTRLTSLEGGYHLVSLPTMPIDPFLGVRKEPAPPDLIFGFAGPIKSRIQVRTRFSETKWENLLPVESPSDLPAGYESAKELLDDHSTDVQQRFLYGTSIQASVENHLGKLWLLNYSHPDTTMGTHPWGLFLEKAGGLEPLYVYQPRNADEAYVAYLTAAVDLDQDGTDELVVEASYRIGTAYKIVSKVKGKYQETLTSYYRGPEQGK
jgi:hypothetical protein